MKSPRPQLRWIVGACALAFASEAFARAGGGQNYSSAPSGRGSSGGGGDGSGLGEMIFWIVRLTFDYPQVMCPLISVALLYWWWSSTRKQPQDSAPDKLIPDVQLHHAAPDADAEIRAGNPGFDPREFQARAADVFLRVQAAWSNQKMPSVRSFVSDGVLSRFMGQQRLMRVEGIRDVMADVRVLRRQLLRGRVVGEYQLIDLRFDATARDLEVSAAMSDGDAARRVAHAPLQQFAEVWSFARRVGPQSKQSFGALFGRCPNCGADYPGGPTAQCAYCKAIVNSGYYDWVLCEITQISEWRPYLPSADLTEAIRAKDPGFSTTLIEDRASLVFWRLLGARAENEPALLASVCANEMRAEIGAEIETRKANGQRLSYQQAAVGAAELLAVDLGEEVDTAHVLIRWSARIGTGESGVPTISRWATVLRLERAADAKAPAGRGLATSRCGNCGAVATHDGQLRCESCGKELGARATDWVFAGQSELEAWTRSRIDR